MNLELPRAEREEAIASIERYFEQNFEQRIGNIAAGALLGFFLEEIGPCLYNQAVAEVQERLTQRVQELDIELHAEPFGYWARQGRAAAGRRKG